MDKVLGESAGAKGVARNSSLSVRRAIATLDAIARVADREGRGCPMPDLVKETGLARSTLHRLMAPLIDMGLVEKGDNRDYRIGPYSAFIGGLYLAGLDLRTTVHPHLEGLTESTGETSHLLVRSGTEVTYIDKVESLAALRMHSRVGGRMPMYCTSAGKALLAHLPNDLLEEILQGGLPPRTPKTIVREEDLRRNLSAIRERGYSVDDVENEPGIRCVGAVVFGGDGSPVAAISLAGPVTRITPDRVSELGEVVSREAKAISRRLGAPQAFELEQNGVTDVESAGDAGAPIRG